MSYIGNTSTTQAFTPAVDYFSGNGSTVAFTLSRPVASVAQVQVVIDNVAQNPSSAYTVSGSTITFTSAPLAGTNNIYVYYTSPITQVIAPGQNTVNANSFASGVLTPAAVSDQSNTSTGYFDLPAGTTAQRPVSPNSGMARFNTDTNKAEYYNGTIWMDFNAAGPTSSVEYLVVAGGAGGGDGTAGGGGGAGGFRTATGFSVTTGSAITVTVGGGGTGGGGAGTGQAQRGGMGSNSVFGSITSLGGGSGGAEGNNSGLSGGSGGGSSYGGGANATGTTGQGNRGGAGTSGASRWTGGGGGGAGAVGGDASTYIGGVGGDGLSSSISGASVNYAGGGGGAAQSSGAGTVYGGAGGLGGGGAGAADQTGSTVVYGGDGSTNTGSGGGGGPDSASARGGNGGSGIVIIRYSTNYAQAASTTGSPTYTSSSGYHIYKWTSSGSITF